MSINNMSSKKNIFSLFFVILIASNASALTSKFDDVDNIYPHINLNLEFTGFRTIQPTDIQFLPDHPSVMIVAGKTGKLGYFDQKRKKKGIVHQFKVRTRSELGLLGIAFHPNFKKNRRVFIHYNPLKNKQRISRISEFKFATYPFKERSGLNNEKVIFEVEQPYVNHDGGQIAFGPDGMLYIGLGDGGSGGDPENNGQNTLSYLGTILRIDVDSPTQPYGVPSDNPFIKNKNYLPEIWAYGLRNPWKFSFLKNGDLIVGDVGQGKFEEITRIKKGGNHGWNIREASHCYPTDKKCKKLGMVDPVFEYGRNLGQSITGGFELLKSLKNPKLRGKYILGDFASGRIWALEIGPKNTSAYSCGTFAIQISTFGRNKEGQVYLADFASGRIFKIQ